MNLIDIVIQHPEYRRLLAGITAFKARSADAKLFSALEINGMPFTLQEALITALTKDLQLNILYSARDALEIRKFLPTIQVIELSNVSLKQQLNILNNHNFKRCLKVLQIGDYSLTGDVLTLWAAGYVHPIRISYLGNDFESASFYDEIYGRKYHELTSFCIGDLGVFDSASLLQNLSVAGEGVNYLNALLLFGGDNLDTFKSDSNYTFDFAYPSIYFQRFDILAQEIENKLDQGYDCRIITGHKDVLPNSLQKLAVNLETSLEAGLQSEKLKLLVLTDRELFGTIFLNKATKRLTTDKARKMLAELEGEIEINDYIVHEDYGIGIYKGIKQEKFEQRIPLDFGSYKTNIVFEDYILIAYAESDELYVPLSQINKITKYIGSEDEEPHLTRLGKTEWATIKKKARADIEKMAKDLVAIYAQRELAHGPKIDIEDSPAYKKFTAAFPYEVTKDQLRAEFEVTSDLALEKPMNRLIVGDVGFGKTEVAVRAAFKMVEAGYQVAVLCPTTVLTAQHEKVFADRFRDSNFVVAAVSRMNVHDNKKILEALADGKVDVIIGTHRLLSQDIQFKKLGLLIIDEEQKFGVKQKEKIKKLEFGVHVLALSATPIPRTLSMALSAIQEISLIQTAPANRKQIETKVMKMDWQKVVTAIQTEVARDGQVYYLHNRVETIQSTYQKLKGFLPGIRFAVAHGQMNPQELGKVMTNFYDKEFDCLICTTIIENGLDMPNVNTIIVEHSQNFGLGQLYQLRGRVGRSERQAFAYLFYEGSSIDQEEKDLDKIDDATAKRKKIKELDYKRRLKAILESQDLGSGFRLASRDLEIRGAGNLLGKQQSGNIKYMGYGLYMQLLAEEIEKLKNENQY